MKTITFEDGYTVQIENGILTRTHPKKSSAHVSRFTEIPVTSREANHILQNGKSLSDYMTSDSLLIRATNGVREAIAEEVKIAAEIAAARNAKWDAERQERIAKAKVASGLKDPVTVYVERCDGWPLKAMVNDAEVPLDRVVLGDYDFVERSVYEQALEDKIKADALKLDVQLKAKQAAESKMDEARAKAVATGKPVDIDRWTTDRCMNGHSDCSFDNATKFIMPDGSEKTVYNCCY